MERGHIYVTKVLRKNPAGRTVIGHAKEVEFPRDLNVPPFQAAHMVPTPTPQYQIHFYMYLTAVGNTVDVKASNGSVWLKRTVEFLALDKKGKLVEGCLSAWETEARVFNAKVGDVVLALDAKTSEYNGTVTLMTTITGCLIMNPKTTAAKELKVAGDEAKDKMRDDGNWALPFGLVARKLDVDDDDDA